MSHFAVSNLGLHCLLRYVVPLTSKKINTKFTIQNSQDRNVVVRDVDGTLRAASWDERDRLTQIYSPFPGRKLFPPKMFEEEQLEVSYQRYW